MIDTVALNNVVDRSGLKKIAIAERLGMTVQTLTRKLNGEAEFTVSEAQDLSDMLALSGSQLRLIFFPRV